MPVPVLTSCIQPEKCTGLCLLRMLNKRTLVRDARRIEDQIPNHIGQDEVRDYDVIE